MLQKDSPIVVIAEEDRVEEAIMRLGRIGFDNVVGYLQNGMLALDQRPELLSQTPRITAVAMHELEEKPTVIDVRTPTEWDAGHIAGSINIPLNRLSDRLDEVPATGVVVVHCQGGYRSSTAASMLHKAGRSNLFDLVGGYQAWSAAEKTSEASVQPE
jgi:rhodanese-related sulfurtransferase